MQFDLNSMYTRYGALRHPIYVHIFHSKSKSKNLNFTLSLAEQY